MEWSKNQVSQLRKLRHHGFSCREIGIKLGFSKNAVVGKLHRLGLSAATLPPSLPRQAIAEPTKTPERFTITFADLQPEQCHCPSGMRNYLFCGKPIVPGTPYCATCLIICRPSASIEVL